MLFTPIALKVFNQILAANSSSRKLISRYHSKTFKLLLPGFSFSAACDSDGYLITTPTENYDVVINIPLQSATFLIDHDKLAVYKNISFSGDTDFGHELLDIFSKLHLDSLYTTVRSPLMLMTLNKFTNLIKTIGIYIKKLSTNSSNALKEYLMYETQDIITRFENDKFCNDVDELYARSEYLEQQIKALAQTIGIPKARLKNK